MFSISEIWGKLTRWDKPYRFVMIRKPAPVKDKKQITPRCKFYHLLPKAAAMADTGTSAMLAIWRLRL